MIRIAVDVFGLHLGGSVASGSLFICADFLYLLYFTHKYIQLANPTIIHMIYQVLFMFVHPQTVNIAYKQKGLMQGLFDV
ncbi:MAG TPA: hypothetical protein DDZ89_05445 [Clostridiales bacterium]|nr:hypothetical protein [Clostridiales bacterium]